VDATKIHILVLDRDRASAGILHDALSAVGYNVTVTSHESDAVAAAEQ
jgi:CheY-like chemotaxis protein